MKTLKPISLLLVAIAVLSAVATGQTTAYPESNLTPNYAADTGAVNALVATSLPCGGSLPTGLLVRVKPANANTTTTPTLNWCGFGAKTITKFGTTALVASDLTTTAVAVLIYDGSGFELTNPQTATASGTVTSIATTGPISGGTISTSGTISCPTCVTSAASLGSGNLMTGAGSQASQTNANIAVSAGGLFTTYNNLTTAGLGFPTIIGTPSDVTSQTASQTAVNLIASTPAAGHFLIRYYLDQNAVCATPGPGQVLLTFSWTDASHAHSASTVPLNFLSALSTAGGYLQGTIPIFSATASAVSYTSTYTACTTGTASYDAHATIEETK